MATKLYELYQQPNSIITEFSKWLLDSISKIIKKVTKRYRKFSSIKEKLWIEFHSLRSSSSFIDKWVKFLTDCGITIEPLFYQQLTLNLFISLIEKALPVTVDDDQYKGANIQRTVCN